jgi:uncharacterized RDD family membrane protein YckC
MNQIVPPEGVPLHFTIAGLGARLGAQLTDLGLSVIFLIVLGIVTTNVLPSAVWWSLMLLTFFAIRTPYYIATELMWNGQTLGKRMLGLRVVGADGRGLSTNAVVVRNLMREAEIYGPGFALLGGLERVDIWYWLTLLWAVISIGVPIFSKSNQRLGDLIAGTYVIEHPRAGLPSDLAAKTAEAAEQDNRFNFTAKQLDYYGRYELQILEQLLQSTGNTKQGTPEQRQEMIRVSRRIRAKIKYLEQVKDSEAADFLHTFYAAQRGHLEQRRLFGDVREDKFHGSEDGPSKP